MFLRPPSKSKRACLSSAARLHQRAAANWSTTAPDPLGTPGAAMGLPGLSASTLRHSRTSLARKRGS